MSGPAARRCPAVYQLRVVLDQISPLIWRRLLVTETTTLADLHHILQTAFGWADAHLHQFVIHGVAYGIHYDGGPWFIHDARTVPLSRFGLRVGERFRYEYDFGDLWVHQIRVEAISESAPGRRYPVCTGGARTAPPEDCGGPWAFLALRQERSRWAVTMRLAELLEPLLHADPDSPHAQDVLEELIDAREALAELAWWARIDTFDRRAVNQALAALATSPEEPP
jgi:hypothetical protein